MLISFDKSDFKDQFTWETVLARLNVPVSDRIYVETITVETTRVNATQLFDTRLKTVRYNPDTGVMFE